MSLCVWKSQGSIDMFSLSDCGARDMGHVHMGCGEWSCGRSSRASWSHERKPPDSRGWKGSTALQVTRQELQMAIGRENVTARSLELTQYPRRKRADFYHHKSRESTATLPTGDYHGPSSLLMAAELESSSECRQSYLRVESPHAGKREDNSVQWNTLKGTMEEKNMLRFVCILCHAGLTYWLYPE